jgi:hypothetical protein
MQPRPPGPCATVTALDLQGAFDGQLAFGEARGDDTSWTLKIVDAEGEGLRVGIAGTVPIFETKAAYADQGVPFREVEGLGVDAFRNSPGQPRGAARAASGRFGHDRGGVRDGRGPRVERPGSA